MIMLPAAVRIFLCSRPTDMRKSFDGPHRLGPGVLEIRQDPLTGHLFLFVNRRGDRIKILYFDRDGLALWYSELEAGTFEILACRRRAGGIRTPARGTRHDPLRNRAQEPHAKRQAIPPRRLNPQNAGENQRR